MSTVPRNSPEVEAAIQRAIEKLSAMTEAEFQAHLKTVPPHPLTETLKNSGYFEALLEDLDEQNSKRK